MLLVEMAGIFVRVADDRMPSGIACNRRTRARKLGSRSMCDSRNSQRAEGGGGARICFRARQSRVEGGPDSARLRSGLPRS